MVVFLPCVLTIYYIPLKGKRRLQNVFLLLASLGFYAWGEPWFVFIMLASIIGNWGFGIWVDRVRESKSQSCLVIALMLVFNLSIIFVFKYLGFAVRTVNGIFGADITVPEIALPIGISFFTFQAISYVIDVYREKGEMQKNLLNVGLYISFFPQLIAGPIVRYETISDQIMGRKENWKDFSEGSCRFIVGLCKKVLLANNFALVADKAFAMGSVDACSTAFAWMGAIAYTLQIYYDFSGYSDMAIGLGRMFGFHFPENFNYPYISSSITEFWRRWHISLGSWFRDYVYIPLGGSRVGRGRLIINLFVVWLLTGIWHGANWTFICWGVMYGVLLTIEKLTGLEKRNIPDPIRHIYTMLFVIIGWVFFRADSLSCGMQMVEIMFGGRGAALMDANFRAYLSENIYYFLFGIYFSMPIAPRIGAKLKKRFGEDNIVITVLYCLLMTTGMLLSLSFLIKGAYNPFIYFNF